MNDLNTMDSAQDININDEYIAALDIGSSKLTISIGRNRNGEYEEFIGAIHVETAGIKHGRIVNHREVVNTLKNLIKDAESILGFDVDEVHVGVSDNEVNIHENSAMVPIKDHVTKDDIDRVLLAAEAMPLKPYESILHVLPIDYFVDKIATVNPVGQSGVRLDVSAKIVTIPTQSVEMVKRVCEEAGLTPVELIFSPLATSQAVTNKRQAFLGTIVIDMGAGTTDVVVYEGNKIKYFDVIPIGGDYITDDISHILHCLKHEAESIKINYGVASPEFVNEEDEVINEYIIDGYQESDGLSCSFLSQIIEARINETIDLVFDNIARYEVEIKDSFEIILTGGTSQLKNIKEYVENYINLKTSLGMPNIPYGVFDSARSPRFSSSVGLLKYADTDSCIKEISDPGKLKDDTQKPNKFGWFMQKVSSFFD